MAMVMRPPKNLRIEGASYLPPTAIEVSMMAAAVADAVSFGDGITELQDTLIRAYFRAMSAFPVPPAYDECDPETIARLLADRDRAFRVRLMQFMSLVAIVSTPVPEPVATRVREYSAALGVDDGLLELTDHLAQGALGVIGCDFDRNGYSQTWHPALAAELRQSHEVQQIWDQNTADEHLAARWRAMEEYPRGTVGKAITEFYATRGFAYPGTPLGAPLVLTQHDWVHILADYGTTVESELEIFAFIARANDDLRGFSLLAMVVSLFETGTLSHGLGFFDADKGHLSRTGMIERMSDAMRRGAAVRGSVDFMAVDWLEIADIPVVELRRHFGIGPKSEVAIASGSVGPWEPGGLTPYQVQQGRNTAGASWDPRGASVVP